MGAPEAGRDDEAGAPAFLGVGKLVGKNAGEGFRSHPGTRKHPRPLQVSRRRDHDHGIALRGEPDLEQERDVEHDDALAARRGAAEKPALDPAHQRVDDRLQPAQLRPVAEHPLAQHRPVDGTVPHHAGEGLADGLHRGAAARQQTVHRSVGIVYRQAEMAEHPGRRRLAHPDGTGEADDHHAGPVSRGGRPRRDGAAHRRPRVRRRTRRRSPGGPDEAASPDRRRRDSRAPARRRAAGSPAGCRRYR